MLSSKQVQSLATALRALDLDRVMSHFAKLDASSVHGRFGPKPGEPTEYDDLLDAFDDVEEREEKALLLSKLEELVDFYRHAALREDAVHTNVS